MPTFARLLGATAALAALAPATASAQNIPMAGEGQLILSAERMFGFSVASSKTKPEEGDGETTTSINSLSLLGVSAPAGVLNPYLSPTLGVHYTVIPSLTVGGNLGYARLSLETERKSGGTTTTTEGDPTNLFIIGPRVGYIVGLSPTLGLWLRGGVTYYRASTSDDDDNSNTRSGLGLNLDPMLVYSPVNHMGITIGPNIDLPLTGSAEEERKNGNTTVTTKYDVTYRNFGVTLGLLAHF